MPTPRKNPKLTLERAREVLRYEPATGALIWQKKIARQMIVGTRAGSLYKNGYRIVTVDREIHPASRVIWLMMTGEWPTMFVDHINGNRADDRWVNLREATPLENQRNRRALVGLKGVSWHKGKWRARIHVGAQQLHLGRFESDRAAAIAYDAAARQHFGEFARLNFPEAR